MCTAFSISTGFCETVSSVLDFLFINFVHYEITSRLGLRTTLWNGWCGIWRSVSKTSAWIKKQCTAMAYQLFFKFEYCFSFGTLTFLPEPGEIFFGEMTTTRCLVPPFFDVILCAGLYISDCCAFPNDILLTLTRIIIWNAI